MITSAACRATVNGTKQTFKVHRHSDFFLWMKQLNCKYDKLAVEQGFINWDREDIPKVQIKFGTKNLFDTEANKEADLSEMEPLIIIIRIIIILYGIQLDKNYINQ